MAIEYDREVLTSGYNLSKINSNFQKIETALEDGLSRSGQSPNQMNADIDMNSNDLLNVKTLDVENITYQGQSLAPETLVVTDAMLKSQYDPTNVGGDAFSLDNHSGTVSTSQIEDAAVNLDKLSASVKDSIDPLRGFYGDAVNNDTVNFSTLEGIYVGRTFDLKAKVYKVDAIPSANNYINGFFAVTNGESINPKDILYPAKDTLTGNGYKLTNSNRYNAWPQDKWHDYNGVIFAVWNQGTSHTSNDLHPVMARSYDGGTTFINFERLFQSRSFTGGVTSWSCGIVDGQQIMFVRQGDPVSEHRLYCRRIGEKKKVVATLSSPASGTAGWELVLTEHGCRSGNQIKFASNVSIGGTTIVAGTSYTVNSGSATRLVFTGPNSSSAQSISGTYVIEFVESGWTEINWAGVAVGTHLINTNPDQISQPTLFHSFAGIPGSGGDFYTCVHGGSSTAGPTLLFFENILSNSPILSKYNKITTASRVEATVTRDPTDGYLYGFARTQFTNNSPLAWWSSDGGDTFNTNIGGPVGALQYSPFPCKIVGDYIYAYGSGNRTGTDDVTGNYLKGEVPLFLFKGLKSEFRSNYWAALQMIQVGTAYKWSDFEGVNAVGVGSMVVYKNKLILAHSTDNEDPGSVGTGIPDIEFIHLEISQPNKFLHQSFVGRGVSNKIPSLAVYDTLHVENLTGSSGIYAKALVRGTDGLIYGGENISVSRSSTGLYTITWPSVGSANRVFAIAASRNSNGDAQAISVTPTGCTVRTTTRGTTTLADFDFQISVDYISDWSRTSWT